MSNEFDNCLSPRIRLKRLWLPLWLATLLTAAGSANALEISPVDSVEISTSPVWLNPDDPKQERVGRLVWRGGLEIMSRDSRVGGFSGLVVSPDGRRLLAVSDKGYWLSARLRYDGGQRLSGLDEGSVARMRGLDGETLSKKKWRDAESLAALDDGSYLVSFERKHRFWRYSLSHGLADALPTAWPKPEGFKGLRKNRGVEALVALRDGGILALAQDRVDKSDSQGFLWHEKRWSRLTYHRPEGFGPSGATRLPGGDVLVLERKKLRSSGFIVRLVRLSPSDLGRGANLRGHELARLEAPLTVENFEGVAARKGPGGETLIYLLSDDDLTKHRRTLLVMFELVGSKEGHY